MGAIKKIKKHMKEIKKSGGTLSSVPEHMLTERTQEIVSENTRGLVLAASMPSSSLSLGGKEKYDYNIRNFEGSAIVTDKIAEDYPLQKSKLTSVSVTPSMTQNGVEFEGARAEDPIYIENFDEDYREQIETNLQTEDGVLKYGKNGKTGFFTMKGINKYPVPAGTGGSTDHSQKTVQECLDDFNHIYHKILKQIPGMVPAAVWVDTQLMSIWTTKEQIDSNHVPYNVAQLLQQKYKGLKFYEDPSLKDDLGNATFAIADNKQSNMQVRNIRPLTIKIDDKKTSEFTEKTTYGIIKSSVAEMKRPFAMVVAQGVTELPVYDIHERR